MARRLPGKRLQFQNKQFQGIYNRSRQRMAWALENTLLEIGEDIENDSPVWYDHEGTMFPHIGGAFASNWVVSNVNGNQFDPSKKSGADIDGQVSVLDFSKDVHIYNNSPYGYYIEFGKYDDWFLTWFGESLPEEGTQNIAPDGSSKRTPQGGVLRRNYQKFESTFAKNLRAASNKFPGKS